MRLNLVRLATLNADAAAICQAARFGGREVLVCISHALVELQLEFVFLRVRIGIAVTPEGFDKLFALFVRFEFLPRVAFGLREDWFDVIDPLDVSLFEFALDLAWLFVGTWLCLLGGD